jgi:hypothetical protein
MHQQKSPHMPDADVIHASSEKLFVSLKDELVAIGIPPRPVILQSIEREMHKDEPDFSKLEIVISLDVGVAASLLKIANSPFLGSSCVWCDLGRFRSPYPCGFPGCGLLQPAWLLDSLTPSIWKAARCLHSALAAPFPAACSFSGLDGSHVDNARLKSKIKDSSGPLASTLPGTA